MYISQGKFLTKNASKYINKINQGIFSELMYLGWSLKHVAQNYLFISISSYRNIAILCAKMSHVMWALM